MSASLEISWREGVKAVAAGEGRLIVEGGEARVSLQNVSPVIADALCRLNHAEQDESSLADLVRADKRSLARWYFHLTSLSRRGLLCQSASAGGKRLATLVPVSASFVAPWTQVLSRRRYVLSRFAYLHRMDSEAMLESPLGHARIIVNDGRVAAVIAGLAKASTTQELASQSAIAEPTVGVVLTLLLRAGMLSAIDDQASCAEDENTDLQTWAFHDLLFHSRSRRGRSDAPYGATYRFAGKTAPPRALKAIQAGEALALDRPDLAQLERQDPALTHVLEQRRTVRDYDAESPISRRQLGEFLFRVGRVKDQWQEEVATAAGPIRMSFASRPYPAGGCLYELELYVAVNACDNLEAGLYYYDAERHRLIRQSGRTAAVAGLLRDAADATGVAAEDLQVLLILAARLPRLAWKYESLAYALTLKHVGVVFQNMYLVATAMGLAPCAVGSGDADLFTQAAGVDPVSETSVGEFLLGSRASELDEPHPVEGFFLANGPSDLPAVGKTTDGPAAFA